MDARSCFFNWKKRETNNLCTQRAHLASDTYNARMLERNEAFYYSNHIAFSLWSFTCAHHVDGEDCNHVSVYIQKVISFLTTFNQIVLDTEASRSERLLQPEQEESSFGRLLHRTNVDLNLIQLAIRYRFLYWRVCCYVCTREPKKNKKRQMIRRETYRQQQQLALQDRPA